MRRMSFVLTAFVFAVTASTGQNTNYMQWEVMYITPKADKIDLFKKGLAAHNKKYHPAGAYHASIAAVVSGPNTGAFAWIMGPTTWTQMDGRPGAGEHQLDWDKNVGMYVEKYSESSYWRLNTDVNYRPEGADGFLKQRDRVYDVKPGQGARFTEQIKKVLEVYKQKKYVAAYSLYERVDATAGHEAIVGISFAKWAYFDSQPNFRSDFESVHGVGSFDRFLEELDICLDRSETFDELLEWMPDLGG
jgi:hypothetical protein